MAQRDTAMSVVAWRRRGSGGSAKRGGGAQRDGSSAVGGTQRLWRIHQHRPQMRRRTHLRTPRRALERRNILIPTYGPIIDSSKKNCKYLQYLWLVW